MLAIKIVNCRDPLMWYRPFVGKYVPFVRHALSENCFIAREPTGYANIVKIQDAELIEALDQEIDFIEYY